MDLSIRSCKENLLWREPFWMVGDERKSRPENPGRLHFVWILSEDQSSSAA
jgi:hypothetical protein